MVGAVGEGGGDWGGCEPRIEVIVKMQKNVGGPVGGLVGVPVAGGRVGVRSGVGRM